MTIVVRHTDAAAFLARAEPWLLEAEAENNLILGVAGAMRASTTPAEGVYFATVECDGAVVGCAFRTPPHKLGLTDMPADGAAQLAHDVAMLYDTIPAVLGPEAPAQSFARAWCARVGATAQTGMRQRIYQLTRTLPPQQPPPGELRVAKAADVGIVREWISAFRDEAAHDAPQPNDPAPLVARGAFHIWWLDGVARTLVGVAARTPNGVRVGPVYTPPDERGRGFASAAVAAVSQRELDRGARFCFLYTDLANATSNSIYQRIGYEPVCDVVDCRFT